MRPPCTCSRGYCGRCHYDEWMRGAWFTAMLYSLIALGARP